MRGGFGTATVAVPGGGYATALAVANALGDVFDPEVGELVAGPRVPHGGPRRTADLWSGERLDGGHTTLVVVVTDRALGRDALSRVAQMAHDGIARVEDPAHTMADGDVVFAVSLGAKPADPSAVGWAAAAATARAIVRGCRQATGLPGLPAWSDLHPPGRSRPQ